MKALELAKKVKISPDVYADLASDELRRLAEVNAELLEALEACVSVWNKGGHEWQTAFHSAKSAIAKAKEQQ